MTCRCHKGLTLIELLVVVAILGILVAMALPAIQQARESARATECRNHLRQIGIALQNYHSAHDSFPPGCIGAADDPVSQQGWGWGALLLPFLEEQPLYERLDPRRHALPAVLASADLQPLLRTPLTIFRCASDVGDELQNDNRTLSGFMLGSAGGSIASLPQVLASAWTRRPPLLACITPVDTVSDPSVTNAGGYGVRAATSNYVASFGDLWRADSSAWASSDFAGNGVFGSNASVRIEEISDGTSRTFAVGERSWHSFASIWAGTDGWNRCEREGMPMVLATAWYRMNSNPEPFNLSCDPQGAAGYGSLHPGGSHFLMADGSVRFIDETIDFANATENEHLGVYQRLARRNDGQPQGDF